MRHAWSPNCDRFAHQASTFEDTTIRVVSLTLGRDDVFVDEPDSERSFAVTDHDGEHELR